ncbi:hypothetical protein B0T22DRAFT_463982 [Podospora appendiculata]|uniref:Pre-mRNA splicing factor n=1 Tax=Podospora appendiculata TaxID=314037 RepID=A0AAE0X401_9PEZI|nr:hypothetical protein B0T22DRAFT_463982 [Podospora appendiculata]
MTRRIVYSAALVALVAAMALTIAAVSTPKWVSYSVTAEPGRVHDHIGLHRRCTSTSGSEVCVHFPSVRQCEGDGRFCAMWRTTGFLMNLAVVAELAAVVGFLVIMAGGKMKREGGWRILGVLLGLVAAVQFCATALVTYALDNDDFFHVPGYRLDSSWYFATSSACIAVLCAFGLAISAFVLPPEDGYEFLDDRSARV